MRRFILPGASLFGTVALGTAQVAVNPPPGGPDWDGPWALGTYGLCLLTVGLLIWAIFDRRAHVSNEPNEPQPQIIITSHNQSGGITAHTVNQGPSPAKVKAFPTGVKNEKCGSDEFLTEYQVDVDTVYPVKQIDLVARAPSVVAIRPSARRPNPAMMSVNHFWGVADGTKGKAGISVFDVTRSFALDVVTRKPEPAIRLEGGMSG